MQVADFMSEDPVVIGPHDSPALALQLMDSVGVRHLPVVDDGVLVGVLSDRDLLGVVGWRMLGPAAAERGETVDGLMEREVVTVAPEDSAVVAAVECSVRAIGCLPVVRDGELVGIVSETDLIRLVSMAGGPGLADDRDVSEIAAFPVTAVPLGAPIALIGTLMDAKAIRHVPVMDERNVLVGMVSDRDLRRALGAGLGPGVQARQLMTPGPVGIDCSTTIADAAAYMCERRVSALVVHGGPDGLGIVTTTDFLETALEVI